jgi:hypothetical protein
MLRTVAKPLVVTVSSAPSLLKAIGKSLSRTVSVVAQLADQYMGGAGNHTYTVTLAVAASVVPSLNRAISKIFGLVSATTAPLLVKKITLSTWRIGASTSAGVIKGVRKGLSVAAKSLPGTPYTLFGPSVRLTVVVLWSFGESVSSFRKRVVTNLSARGPVLPVVAGLKVARRHLHKVLDYLATKRITRFLS